ncbi:MAG: CoA pyrophosphatase [Candidatus Marinimicrobia bacterium]|jgi:8-oxo-dGTP pyrophosphatase MutT (NUDIX family)|nr:CoA pyrophosphatase [Candidatus Neomarinimicrobiota bacterium]MBT4713908.1 CoA pyrophosphatase [Candidatus Neomarinimicrobiota bacterium]MBT4946881.1 CoA pyrophosphatase [Candidatus Neomarinimicrobiota bacterium]MBT5270813.1 CoA pyrophosphatase [Candidatus Neomarinimicrobiota bacterium]MBT6012157.1 CoA pyrophosphatase [Candidatus Neomarinimicrobiota bacterium]
MDHFIEKLSELLKQPLPGWMAQKHLMPEGRELKSLGDNLHPAAVLISLYPQNGEWVFPLIRRTIDGFVHSGQIALPGGRRDGTETDIETALREAYEEVNILPEQVEVLGLTSVLPIPVSNHIVQPVVGYTRNKPDFIPEPKEVAEIFTVSIKSLCEREIQYESRHFKNRDWEIPFFEIDGHKVWGATAMILSEFRTLVTQLI